MTEKINWMMDETIAGASPKNWEEVRRIEHELVKIIGIPALEHELVDPVPCLKNLASQLEGQQFSCVIDLTGWLTPVMQELFPKTPVENQLSMSRVRVVSSPGLETTGHMISLSPPEIEKIKRETDLSHPLIVDDVSFSGWTSLQTMRLLGVEPYSATHAFLIANTGNLGSNPGAVSRLTTLGSKVFFGHELITPRDDGWHLKDLHRNPNPVEALNFALDFQNIVKRDGENSVSAKNFFKQGNEATRIVFPQTITSDQLKILRNEGRFIFKNGSTIDDSQTHAKNPFLWASKDFSQHIDVEKVESRKDEIVALITELENLTADPNGKIEASKNLSMIVRCQTSING